MTAEELFELPEDNWRHELVDGELTTNPYATGPEGAVSANLTYLIGTHVHESQLGRCVAGGTGFLLGRGPDTVRAPDFAFTSAGRLPGPATWFYSSIAPDLVVEMVAPTDRYSEVLRKTLCWLDAGVRLVWVVDPQTELIAVYRPGGLGTMHRDADATLSGEDVLPGFSARLGDIFS